jgi:hypothetical protein
MFLGFSCFGVPCIPTILQSADIRQKYHLEGDIVTDLLKACCCGCCFLIQQEKEVEERERLLAQHGQPKVEGYSKVDGMDYKQ